MTTNTHPCATSPLIVITLLISGISYAYDTYELTPHAGGADIIAGYCDGQPADACLTFSTHPHRQIRRSFRPQFEIGQLK